jgi:DNA-binding PucR family transcriptional regulator
LPSLCEALNDQMVREMPELASDRSVEELLNSSVNANVSRIIDVFEQGLENADLEAPAAAIEYARRLAQRGVPTNALLRAYRLGQAGFVQRMLQGIAAASLKPEVVVEASIELSATTFTYIDRLSEQVFAAYQQERDRWMRNRGAVRSARAMSVLANGAPDIDEAEKALGYPLRQSHRGVVVWADDSTPDADRLTHLERVIGKLAEHYRGDRAPLVIAPDDSTIWAWLSMSPAGAVTDRSAPVVTDAGSWIALGSPAPGVDGFRLTHRQAGADRRHGRRCRPSQTDH